MFQPRFFGEQVVNRKKLPSVCPTMFAFHRRLLDSKLAVCNSACHRQVGDVIHCGVFVSKLCGNFKIPFKMLWPKTNQRNQKENPARTFFSKLYYFAASGLIISQPNSTSGLLYSRPVWLPCRYAISQSYLSACCILSGY